jgi:hypothetical protein
LSAAKAEIQAGRSRISLSAQSGRRRDEGHRLDAIPIQIADEGRIVSAGAVRPQAGRAIARSTGRERCGVKCVDAGG